MTNSTVVVSILFTSDLPPAQLPHQKTTAQSQKSAGLKALVQKETKIEHIANLKITMSNAHFFNQCLYYSLSQKIYVKSKLKNTIFTQLDQHIFLSKHHFF